ncbi:MAG TPA: TlpA disulfide reductase family protein [Candidatus Acidoferrum sp.]|nr:TlpA disulfide reductase family protein [Candidatus Acidoferrum sp.]
MATIAAGKNAPGFSLKGMDGKPSTLKDALEHGPVVAAFFKISCPVCQFTFPFLERLYQRYGGKDIAFWGVSEDDAGETKNFAKEYGVTFPMLLDEKKNGYPASNAYGLTNVPSIFLIEPDGNVKVSCIGFDKKELEKIAAHLAERQKIPPAALFRTDESVPDYKPG